jgi:hypothetical protein
MRCSLNMKILAGAANENRRAVFFGCALTDAGGFAGFGFAVGDGRFVDAEACGGG